MATKTTNYNLTKPAYDDDADIAVINANMDIIDAKMKEIEEAGGGSVTPVDAYTKHESDELLSNKVDKVTGKGLSTNDYTDEEKNKLNAVREQVSELKSDLDNYKELVGGMSVNLFDESQISSGKYYDGSIGANPTIMDNSNYFCFIMPVKPSTNYTLSGISRRVLITDDNDIILRTRGSEQQANFTFSTGANASKAYISVNGSLYPANEFMAVEGDVLPSEYAAKGFQFSSSSEKAVKSIVNSEIDPVEIYYVGADKEYTSFTECIKDLQNNEHEKIIYIDGGTYDIFEEIGGATFCATIPSDVKMTDWISYSVVVPPNTSIIGLGNVIFNFNPTLDEIGNGLNMLSPLNIRGTCSVENITINASNCRYCIHDETQSTDFNGSHKKYRNVKCYKSGSGQPQAYAAGFDDLLTFDFEHCLFSSSGTVVFSMHNQATPTPDDSTVINIKDCVFVSTRTTDTRHSVRFGNVNWRAERIKVFISGCYMSDDVYVWDETDYTSLKQNFDITMVGCNQNSININHDESKSENLYPGVVYSW